MSSTDILVVAFGAMIGWGWVVSSGRWIQNAGVIGTVIGFIIGGVMIYFVGMTPATLTFRINKKGKEEKCMPNLESSSEIYKYILIVYSLLFCFNVIIRYVFYDFISWCHFKSMICGYT